MEEKNIDGNKGWSWLGFFFAPYYYAGYGNIKKGLIYAVLGAFLSNELLKWAVEL